MNSLRRDLMFFMEALILIGPLTAFLGYASLLALFVGYPAVLTPLGGPAHLSDNLPLVVALTALPLGIFALAQLWALVRCTAKNRRYAFDRKFRFALASGAISSVALLYLYGLQGLAIGVLPAIVLLVHMAYLQSLLRSGA